MIRRPLGSTGIEVGEVGLGTWELSGDVWGAKDDAVSMAALRAALDGGATFVDTAADYGQGHVEELIGRLWVGGGAGGVRREEVVLATKIRPECMVFAPAPERPITEFFRPEWIRSELEVSLGRLRTDYVDVLFLHTWSRSWGHEDEWFAVMAGLKEAGLIRAIGISVADEGASDANVAVALGQVDVVQCVYSVFQQEPEATLFPLAAKHGVGVVARSVFSSGALVQDWGAQPDFPPGDWRATWPQEEKRDWFAEQRRMAGEVKAAMDGAAAAVPRHEFCLRYALEPAAVSVAIPGSANPDHVRANTAVSGAGALPEEARRQVKQLWLDRRIRGTYNGSG